MKKIAIFGSAFNPPSLGHKSVIESLGHFDLVLLEPSIAHAWGKEMLDYPTRCKLVDAFIKDLGLSNVQRSNVEQALYQPGQSVTTYALLNKIQEIHSTDDLTFVIGPDNFFKFAKFYKAQEITERWTVMACPEKIKIRSTDIRKALMEGKDISAFTTLTVSELLLNEGLYRETLSGN
ncbi:MULTISPECIES: nicotinate-nicotinamide nucleotide adenylyltransferase [Vibrio]|jgi:nicotinate-nucleotide adenylyltransferase|uniref:nicotinate-nucleotide adenylyltransferase n=1 Tax=Vibrio natriegens NBRC 15636 = ATCC 14048 = DSM 759 TaxID=1219067 RepID=A0AAN0Y6H8_VIBNA|nr:MULTISPECIES: nicotinate-nicotinamide nucleotide adenylyltransferase [Vibrio]WMN89833.1 nicotinate-nicotinamide nucleotide adenylyltransferase [Vibrio parahaemolyticus]CAH0531816.1 putative nicotinate-nucleotide adenylyltransferase [Catenococcus thiocycli]AEX24902.1 nicotinic acid mononucleotide adenylyltransferase [Vibrio sp. EJY3]ALR18777.1 nicotinic acid mononucleotide adenylyltransferase [Vibrio natriegens NBRC 15636 = ATCC 14048 = DSM 759]ANQ14744.1 nicotinate-nicotinamide nucleotide a